METAIKFKHYTNGKVQAIAYEYDGIALVKCLENKQIVDMQDCNDFEEACFLAMEHVGFIA